MILIQNKLNLPLDIVIFLNTFVKYEKLTNQNIQEVVNLWIENKEECQFVYGHISDWNTSNITSMRHLFSKLYDFNEDLSHWDVSNVTDMSYMFYNATSFNSDLNHWNVKNVRNMSWMFKRSTSFDRKNILKWDLTDVIGKKNMFDKKNCVIM